MWTAVADPRVASGAHCCRASGGAVRKPSASPPPVPQAASSELKQQPIRMIPLVPPTPTPVARPVRAKLPLPLRTARTTMSKAMTLVVVLLAIVIGLLCCILVMVVNNKPAAKDNEALQKIDDLKKYMEDERVRQQGLKLLERDLNYKAP